jgi:hypothetical protein
MFGPTIAGATVGAGKTTDGTVLLEAAMAGLLAGLAVAGTAGTVEAVLPAGAAAGAAGASPGVAVPALLAPERDSPRTARRRMASRNAVSEASPSLVPGVWAKRPRHVESRISRVVFTVI